MKSAIFASFFLIIFITTPLLVFSQWSEVAIEGDCLIIVMPNQNIYHLPNCKLLSGDPDYWHNLMYSRRGDNLPCPECIPFIKWKFLLKQPIQANGLLYTDNYIDISFVVTKNQINYEILNKTDSGIKINWDDLSFVSPAGRASRIIHSGVRLIDRNNSQAPTTIPPESRISDVAIPSENIQYIKNGWQQGLLFEGDYVFYNGKEFSVYFPIEIKGQKKEYLFKFKIDVSKTIRE